LPKPSRWSNGDALKEEADRVWRSLPFPFIEDPLPFKNFDEGALHLKRFASRCTNGAGGRSLEIEVLPARRRWERGVLLPGKRYRRQSFLLSNEALDWNKPGVLVRLQGWAIVAVG